MDQPPTEYTGTVSLVAGQLYDLRVEYYEDQEGATAVVSWSSPTTTKQVIPASQLFQPPSGTVGMTGGVDQTGGAVMATMVSTPGAASPLVSVAGADAISLERDLTAEAIACVAPPFESTRARALAGKPARVHRQKNGTTHVLLASR